MRNLLFQRSGITRQYFLSLGLMISVALIGLFFHDLVGYKVVAFMLLVSVSVLAMFLDIVPVMASAFLSALIWYFFFIPPRFALTVETGEDKLLLLMYFIIALINAVPTHKVRQIENDVKVNESQYLRVFIAQLRKKIETEPIGHHIFLLNQALDTGLFLPSLYKNNI